MNKKEKYQWILIISIILGSVAMVIGFLLYTAQINQAYATVEGIQMVLIITLIKASVIGGMAFIMIRKWFKQEEQYLSDLPFLFGMFFLILVFAKFLDILISFNYYTLEEDSLLVLVKIRYFIMIFDLFPMIYLSVGMILYYLSLKTRFSELDKNERRDEVRIRVLIVIIIIEVLAISLAPNYSTILVILPILVIPSLITIIWLFAFAYKNKRLSQVKPLIIAIGFGLFLATQISRPMAQKVFDAATYAVFSETLEMMVFILIFIGLILKTNYKVV